MTINDLEKTIDSFKIINLDKNKFLELIYVLRAWEIISRSEQIQQKRLTYYAFINGKIELNRLAEIFSKLSNDIKLFKVYKLDIDNLEDEHLFLIIDLLNSTQKLPRISDAFFSSKFKIDTPLVSNQIAELGVKLLVDTRQKVEPFYLNEVYVPFTQGLAYSQYMGGVIFTDGQIPKYSLVAELISVCELSSIDFRLSNALENPVFLEKDNKLKEFKYVLSFPPYSVKQNFDFKNDKYNRFIFQKGTVLDIAHFEHILAQTEYRAVVLMPVGFTFRAGSEELFRKYLVDKNYLEAIIQLPPNLHNGTSIETTFFIINKYRNDHVKKPVDVMFINLKDESFIKREGRQLVFKSVDEIRDIYINKKEIKNISAMISPDEIINNNYSFAIDKYIITEEAKEIQKNLEKFELIKLEDIADIRKSQLFKDEEEGLEVFELSPSNFTKAGFTNESGKIKKIESQKNRLETYKLEPYDVLLSTKGTIGKVAIIGEIKKPLIASQAIQVIRLKDKEGKKEKAICLYMFLKSNMGQTVLSSLTSGTAMPQISTVAIKNLDIPLFKKDEEKKLFLNFNSEIEMYNKIEKINTDIQSIHSQFLGDK